MSFCQGALRLTTDGVLHVRRPLETLTPVQWNSDTDVVPQESVRLGRSPDDQSLLEVRSTTAEAARLTVDTLGRLILGAAEETNTSASLQLEVPDALAPPEARPLALCITTQTYENAVTVDWRGHIRAAAGISSFLGRVQTEPRVPVDLYELARGEVVQVTARCSEGTFAMAKALYPAEGQPLALFEDGWRNNRAPSVRFVSGTDGMLRLMHDGDFERTVDWSVLVLLPGADLPGGAYRPILPPPPPPPPPPAPPVDPGEILPGNESIAVGDPENIAGPGTGNALDQVTGE